MPITIGIDVGTTTITGLAFDTTAGEVLSVSTVENDTNITPETEKARGRSEWDARRMVEKACLCVKAVADRSGERLNEVSGIGITGQQHGVVVVDADGIPITPLVNWEDRRGEDVFPGSDRTFLQEATARLTEEAWQRTGCRLANGWMGLTLFWMKTNCVLPGSGKACFIADLLGALLTGQQPVTEPTKAASSGLFNVSQCRWATQIVEALGLPHSMIPEIREAGQRLGVVTAEASAMTGLPQGLPVFVPIGDNQASFVGSVGNRDDSVLVNVGTGAQVSAFTNRFTYAPPLETRPFPGNGYLLVIGGLYGGRSYAILERFFQSVGRQLLATDQKAPLYQQMNQLSESVPAGADGLRCQPLFTGTRSRPELRAEWTGATPENFTPAHMIRALLEGIAGELLGDFQLICKASGKQYHRLVGSGNGLRQNPVLAKLVEERFAMPLEFSPHQEEAAVGAALIPTLPLTSG